MALVFNRATFMPSGGRGSSIPKSQRNITAYTGSRTSAGLPGGRTGKTVRPWENSGGAGLSGFAADRERLEDRVNRLFSSQKAKIPKGKIPKGKIPKGKATARSVRPTKRSRRESYYDDDDDEEEEEEEISCDSEDTEGTDCDERNDPNEQDDGVAFMTKEGGALSRVSFLDVFQVMDIQSAVTANASSEQKKGGMNQVTGQARVGRKRRSERECSVRLKKEDVVPRDGNRSEDPCTTVESDGSEFCSEEDAELGGDDAASDGIVDVISDSTGDSSAEDDFNGSDSEDD